MFAITFVWKGKFHSFFRRVIRAWRLKWWGDKSPCVLSHFNKIVKLENATFIVRTFLSTHVFIHWTKYSSLTEVSISIPQNSYAKRCISNDYQTIKVTINCPTKENQVGSIDVFPIIFDTRGLRPDLLRFPRVCVLMFKLGLWCHRIDTLIHTEKRGKRSMSGLGPLASNIIGKTSIYNIINEIEIWLGIFIKHVNIFIKRKGRDLTRY